nr:MAG: replication associated protein [Cressdnaviricota sp.]
MLTIPADTWVPTLPDGCSYVKGQQEKGEETGYEHWQVLAVFEKKVSRAIVKRSFGSNGIHAELSRSAKADEYVWKESTRVQGSQFEFGKKPFRRNEAKDWDQIWELAVKDDLSSIPSDVRVVHYRTLRCIAADHGRPLAMERKVWVFWGKTGVGKSRRAWAEAGLDAYPKDPRTKFWNGYAGHENVVLDEFRGGIDVSHLLRWLDRYPVIVEIKGSSVVFRAKTIWITSNLPPDRWYPDLDQATMEALLRRLDIVEIN